MPLAGAMYTACVCALCTPCALATALPAVTQEYNKMLLIADITACAAGSGGQADIIGDADTAFVSLSLQSAAFVRPVCG